MNFLGRKDTSQSKTGTLEWQVCEDEQDWDSAQDEWRTRQSDQRMAQSRHDRKMRRWSLPALGIILLVGAMGGWWSWQRAQVGLAEVERALEGEVYAEVVTEALVDASPRGVLDRRASNTLDLISLPSDPGEITTEVALREIGNDWAVVDVTVQPAADAPTFQQTRVYREGARGWLRAKTSAARWGDARQLETEYLILDYYALDEDAVTRAAPQMDKFYAALRDFDRHRALPIHAKQGHDKQGHDKQRILIDPENTLGQLRSWARVTDDDRIIVASPSAQLVPSKLAASDVLLQSFAIRQFNQLAIKAHKYQKLPGQWFRLHNALRLWLIWEHELPLAVWREPLVHWVFAKAADGTRREVFDVPTFARDLCLDHSLWVRTPLDVSVPILCWRKSDGEEGVRTWPYHYTVTDLSLGPLIYLPSIHWDSLGNSMDSSYELPLPEPNPYALTLATVFEYISHTYGEEGVPEFLAAIPNHQGIETLFPALYGISQTEFEQDWRAYLHERYDIKQ